MRRRPKRTKPPREIFECPHCGADVPIGSAACKECGSDASTGWQSEEEIQYQSLDIPTGWGPEHESKRDGTSWWIQVVAIGVVVAMLFWALRLF